jgi:hypothetical protein
MLMVVCIYTGIPMKRVSGRPSFNGFGMHRVTIRGRSAQ